MGIALNALARKIVGYLLLEPGPVSVGEIAKKAGCSSRMVRYQIDTVSRWFTTNGATMGHARDRGLTVEIDDRTRVRLLSMFQGKGSNHAILSPDERRYVLLGLFLSKRRGHSTSELTSLLRVSRSTLQKDLDCVRQDLRAYGLTLVYSSKDGYSIAGMEQKIREAIADSALKSDSEAPVPASVSRVVDGILASFPVGEPREGYAFLTSLVGFAEERLGTRFTDTARTALVIHLAIAMGRVQDGNRIAMDPAQLEVLKKEKHYAVARDICNRVQAWFGVGFPEDEVGYITLHLLGAKRSILDLEPLDGKKDLLGALVAKMAATAEEFLGFKIVDDELLRGLATHLLAAYYRVKYGLTIRNPLLEEMKTGYPDVYAAAVRAAQTFTAESGLNLPDEEIAYVAMHIGAATERRRFAMIRKKRVAVVCPSGVGTASILSAQLKARFPQVEVAGTYLVAEMLRKVPEDIDAVVSTVPLGLRNVPCAVVSPVLQFEDVKAIDDLLDLIPSNTGGLSPSENGRLFSSLRLTRSAIRFDVDCRDWKEAVRAAGQVLVDNSFCEKRYVDAMVGQIETYGSYVVFKGGLALPHARPSDGVIRTGMSLIRLVRPVSFPGLSNEPVRTVIALACTERLGAQETRQLNELVLGNKGARLAVARNRDELLEVLGDLVGRGIGGE